MSTAQDGGPEHDYVGLCPRCGNIVMAIVDDPTPRWRKEVADAVSNAIRQGYSVQRVERNYLKEHGFGCKCPPPPKQMALSLSEADA